MFNEERTGAKAGLFAGGALLLASAMVQAAPPRVEAFLGSPEAIDMKLSPSGRRLATLEPRWDGRNQLTVVDLPVTDDSRTVAAFSNADIDRFDWVNDDRLIYEATDWSEGTEVRSRRAGTFAVNHDGKEKRQLIAWRGFEYREATQIVSRMLDYRWSWSGTMDNGTDEVWVHNTQYDGRGEITGMSMARLNTSNGALKTTPLPGLDHVVGWLPGPGSQVPMVVQTRWDGRHKLYWRETADKPWTLVHEAADFGDAVLSPEYLEDAEHLIVTASPGGEKALHRFNLRSRELNLQPLVSAKGFDLNPVVKRDPRTNRVLGLHYIDERPQSLWFDDDMKAVQKAVDAALPTGRSNLIACGRCVNSRFYLVFSSSDTEPGEYYLYDQQRQKMGLMASVRPLLTEASQGQRTFHRIEARDGLSLPVYVTHPAGSRPTDKLPAVVLVHGGPWTRGSNLGWNHEAQLLASRGYRVIEPEFRGSTGYGRQLFEAGIKQWGYAMQDDLADAVQWATKQELVDGKRVCIMGSSYGGYAALMGPIRHPGTYRCAISLAGVTDIELRYTAWGNDLTEQLRRYALPALMGDPEADKTLLRSASPLLRVAEIKVPILLVHGAKDRRVPIEHADKFVKAAKAAGVDVDYKTYDLEAHSWVFAANQADYYRRVEAFLAKHLSAGPAAP